MITHNTGLAAGFFALAANAFLIPSTTSLNIDGFAKSLEQLTQPSSRLVKLECPGCSVPEGGISIEGENSLVLDFALTPDSRTLLLNNLPLYPGLPSPFTPVTQTSSSTPFEALRSDSDEVTTSPRYMSYASILKHIEAADGTDSELIDINFHITAIGDEDVNVDALDIRVLKSEDGTLGIGDIIQVSPSSAPSVPAFENGEGLFGIKPIGAITPRPEGCPAGMPDVLCRLRNAMVQHLESLREKAHALPKMFNKHRKPCPGMLRKLEALKKGGVDKFAPQVENAKDAPPHHGHHGHHGHHHHMHRFLHAVHRVLFGFVIPVMIGIAAGMTASIAGMVVGTAIAWAWIRFVRKGKKGNASRRVQLEQGDADVEEEKQGLMSETEEGEAPPVYVEKE